MGRVGAAVGIKDGQQAYPRAWLCERVIVAGVDTYLVRARSARSTDAEPPADPDELAMASSPARPGLHSCVGPRSAGPGLRSVSRSASPSKQATIDERRSRCAATGLRQAFRQALTRRRACAWRTSAIGSAAMSGEQYCFKEVRARHQSPPARPSRVHGLLASGRPHWRDRVPLRCPACLAHRLDSGPQRLRGGRSGARRIASNDDGRRVALVVARTKDPADGERGLRQQQ